jgi:large subunit ribosomal protein L24
MALKIRRYDTVEVISGKDKGKTGKVLRVIPDKHRVIVEGINIIKRHTRPSQFNPNAQAGVIEREAPIHISNVMLVDPKSNKRTRVGSVRENGKRFRVARTTGEKID